MTTFEVLPNLACFPQEVIVASTYRFFSEMFIISVLFAYAVEQFVRGLWYRQVFEVLSRCLSILYSCAIPDGREIVAGHDVLFKIRWSECLGNNGGENGLGKQQKTGRL